MNPQQLLARIAEEGNALLADRSIVRHGPRVPIDPRSADGRPMMAERLLARSWWLILPALLLVPLDLLVALLRWVFYPLAVACWWSERRLARLLDRSYFCPLCSNPMKDPFVYCPHCRRVQPQLRPCLRGVFFRVCECGRGWWLIPGQYLLRTPQPLVCRDTEDFSGCYRPHALPALAGKYSSRHVAITGTTTRAKHAVLAYLFRHLVEGVARIGRYEPAWGLSRLELELCNVWLWQSLHDSTNTRDCDQPQRGASAGPESAYTLAKSFVLCARHTPSLQVFHNLANAWFARTELLVENVLNWKLIYGLVLVLDPRQMGKIVDSDPAFLPQSEIYARLLRAIEEYWGLDGGSVIPLRVAVVLPLPAAEASSLGLSLKPEGLPEAEVGRFVREKDPALGSLLARTVHPDHLGFFAGPIPEHFDLGETIWLQDIVRWMS